MNIKSKEARKYIFNCLDDMAQVGQKVNIQIITFKGFYSLPMKISGFKIIINLVLAHVKWTIVYNILVADKLFVDSLWNLHV